ncbi:hypothetical protein [Victivallis sp. Marseille-Q1083]|uniref:hypothetical protein n=1 Tax=Victivallis sp. Marseille-Q1083 TaxID=2717288 RepID=UPI00158B863E|nr:hypothetical protein [Victivallis sp. Marseille-Q1083]
MSDFWMQLTDWRTLLTGEFNRGYLTGVAVTVLCLIGLLVLRTLIVSSFRYRNTPGIVLPQENGELFVSRAAIRSALGALQSEFPYIAINRVRLYERRSVFSLRVGFDFDARGGRLPDYSAAFKQRIQEVLLQQLGIDAIRDIRLEVGNVGHDEALPKTTEHAFHEPPPAAGL